MNVKVVCIKGAIWVVSVIGKIYSEKHYSEHAAMHRAAILAGAKGKVEVVK